MATKTTFVESERFPGLADYFRHLDEESTCALWENTGRLVSPEPRRAGVPAHWSYDRIRPRLMEAGDWIKVRDAQRRVVVF